jgi:hypothetical protein
MNQATTSPALDTIPRAAGYMTGATGTGYPIQVDQTWDIKTFRLVEVSGDLDLSEPTWWPDERAPLERTLDQLLAACQDLANALRDQHAAWTEPVA